MRTFFSCVVIPLSCLFCTTVYAANADDLLSHPGLAVEVPSPFGDDGVVAIEINGFFSAGMAVTDVDEVPTTLSTILNTLNPLFPVTTEEPLYRHIGDAPNFSTYTKVGIQFDASLTDKLSIVTQLVARGIDNFDVEANWAYIRYEPFPELIIQAGRIRIPTFIFSDFLDVGYAYPWISPPAEVYDLIPIPNATGVQAIASKDFNGVEVTFQPYVGSAKLLFPFEDTELDVTVDNLIGGELSVSYDFITARVGLLKTEVSLKFPYVPGLPPSLIPVVDEIDTTFKGVGVEIDWEWLLLLAEYTERRLEGVMPDTHSWYVMMGVRLGKFMPNVTFSNLRTVDKNKRRGVPFQNLLFDTDQKTVEIGLRYDVIDSVVLKASFQQIDPRNGTPGTFTEVPSGNVKVFNLAVQAVF